MSIVATRMQQRSGEHFEPEAALDPQAQRQLRAHLEQIDYAAFAANNAVIARTLGPVDITQAQRLAVAVAQARAQWIAAAIAAAQPGAAPTPAQIAHIANLRSAFAELTEAYDGLRRLVERGYVPYTRG
jgi:uncharacterized protein YchJ